MNTDKLLTKYEEMLEDISENGLRTKSQKKDFISLVNRIIESFYSKANALAQAEMFDQPECVKDAYFKMKWSLPNPVMMHQYESAIKKYEKAVEQNEIFGLFLTELKNAAEYVRQGQVVKLIEPTPRKTRTETEREAHEARWKSLPKASQDTVEAIIKSVTAPINERHKSRTEYVLKTREEILNELDSIENNKARYARRSEIRNKFGKGVFELLLSPLPEIEKVLEQERLGEFLKIRYASTQRLGAYDIDSATADRVQSGLDGVECDFTLLKNGVNVGHFGFKAVFAGGYNIQRLHTRTLFSDKPQ
jgi:hypothetical protein